MVFAWLMGVPKSAPPAPAAGCGGRSPPPPTPPTTTTTTSRVGRRLDTADFDQDGDGDDDDDDDDDGESPPSSSSAGPSSSARDRTSDVVGVAPVFPPPTPPTTTSTSSSGTTTTTTTSTTEEEAIDVELLRDVMVPMRDGVRLATDVYIPLPAGGAPYASSPRGGNSAILDRPFGLVERAISLRDDPLGGVLVRRLSTYRPRRRYPVILERTPYNKCGESRSEFSTARPRAARRSDIARHMCRRGYVVVMQDCRGKFASGGTFHKYVDEASDGHDLMEWLARQPWCDPKRIGTMGFSYDAHVQSALATSRPRGLACMYIDSGGFSSAYHNGIRRGGAFEMKQVTWAHKHALRAAKRRGDEGLVGALTEKDIFEWFRDLPWRRGNSPLTPVPDYETYLFDEWQEGTFSEYYRRPGMNNEGYYDMFPDVPTAIVGSWQDPYVLSCLTNFVELGRRHESRVTLLMGPWTHGNRSVTHAGDVDFGPQSTLDGNIAEDYLRMRLDWFGRWLKDHKDNGVDDVSRVRFFLMGGGDGRKDGKGRMRHGGRWVHSDVWPPANVVQKRLYLEWRDDDDDGGVGRLSESVPTAGGGGCAAEYLYDPSDPVPTVGGAVTSGEPIMVGGCFDQRVHDGIFTVKPCEPDMPLSARSDVLVFESDVLEYDVAVVGAVEVVLRVSSDCPDTDFTAKLIDVHPPNDDYPAGYAMNVTDGIFRMRYRNGWDHEAFMSPPEENDESGGAAVYEITIRPSATANLFKAGHRIRLDVSSSNFPQFDINPNTGEPEGDWREMRVARNRVHTGIGGGGGGCGGGGGDGGGGPPARTTTSAVVSHVRLPVLEIDGGVLEDRVPLHL